MTAIEGEAPGLGLRAKLGCLVLSLTRNGSKLEVPFGTGPRTSRVLSVLSPLFSDLLFLLPGMMGDMVLMAGLGVMHSVLMGARFPMYLMMRFPHRMRILVVGLVMHAFQGSVLGRVMRRQLG